MRIGGTHGFGLLAKDGQPFEYWLPARAVECLHYLDRHLGAVLGAEQPEILGPSKERYLGQLPHGRSHCVFHDRGCGNNPPEGQGHAPQRREPTNRAERMIVNNYRTVERLKEVSEEPLSIPLLCELHAWMTDGTLKDPAFVGRFRVSNDVHVVDRQTGDVLHVPPPYEELPERVQRMCDFANEDEEDDFMHPVVRAILLHFWLAYDHPFVDGNGRTARALFYWYLLKHGYWLIEFLSISRVFFAAPVQ